MKGIGGGETEVPDSLCPCRYLIPCNHMMLSQRWAVKERDCYSVSAARLLALTPVCCSSGITVTLGNQERDYILWSRCSQENTGRSFLVEKGLSLPSGKGAEGSKSHPQG